MSEQSSTPPASSMDMQSLLTLGGFSTATVFITGLCTGAMSASQVETFAPLIAFGIALVFSSVQAAYLKLIATKGALAILGVVVNATLICTSSAGINSVVASSGGGKSHQAGFFDTRPWFAPTGLKDSVATLQQDMSQLQTTVDVLDTHVVSLKDTVSVLQDVVYDIMLRKLTPIVTAETTDASSTGVTQQKTDRKIDAVSKAINASIERQIDNGEKAMVPVVDEGRLTVRTLNKESYQLYQQQGAAHTKQAVLKLYHR